MRVIIPAASKASLRSINRPSAEPRSPLSGRQEVTTLSLSFATSVESLRHRFWPQYGCAAEDPQADAGGNEPASPMRSMDAERDAGLGGGRRPPTAPPQGAGRQSASSR
jgi:hypothetical protein